MNRGMTIRGTYVRAPDRRAQDLIDACARALAQHGAGGVSVRSICADAGVSPGLLRHYFDGIDDLVAATYAHVGAAVAEALDVAVAAAGAEPRARLAAYVNASFRPPIATQDLLTTWLAFWSLVKSEPAIATLHRDIYAGYRVVLEALLLDAGMAAADVGQAAIAITALVDGLWLELSLEAGVFGAEEAAAIASRWLTVWLPE